MGGFICVASISVYRQIPYLVFVPTVSICVYVTINISNEKNMPAFIVRLADVYRTFPMNSEDQRSTF